MLRANLGFVLTQHTRKRSMNGNWNGSSATTSDFNRRGRHRTISCSATAHFGTRTFIRLGQRRTPCATEWTQAVVTTLHSLSAACGGWLTKRGEWRKRRSSDRHWSLKSALFALIFGPIDRLPRTQQQPYLQAKRYMTNRTVRLKDKAFAVRVLVVRSPKSLIHWWKRTFSTTSRLKTSSLDSTSTMSRIWKRSRPQVHQNTSMTSSHNAEGTQALMTMCEQREASDMATVVPSYRYEIYRYFADFVQRFPIRSQTSWRTQ